MRIPRRIAAAIAIAFTAATFAVVAGTVAFQAPGDTLVLAGNVSSCP